MHRGQDLTLKEKILIVDDTPANISLLTQILSTHGYKVRVALSGKLALQSVQASPADLILLDIKMPDMDGYEVCRQLKASEQTCSIPVIFISALDATFDKVNAFTLGGVDYITKPIEPIEVLVRIEHQLRLRRFQLQMQTQNTQLQLLLTTTQAISSAADVEEALEVILINLCQNLGWELGEAWMPSSKGTVLEYCRCWYGDVRFDEFRRQSEAFRFALGEGLPGRVWVSQQVEWIADITQENSTVVLRAQIAAQAGFKGVLGIPIAFDRQVLAVLIFFHKQEMTPDERSLQLVNAVATQLGSMIQRKKAEEMLRQQAARERLIAEVTQQIRQSLNLDEILDATVNSIRHCLLSDRVAIYQFGANDNGTFVAESVGKNHPKMLGQTANQSWMQECFSAFSQGFPIVLDDIEKSNFTAEGIEFLQRYQVKAAVAMPVLKEDRLWGLLIAHQCAAPRDWQAFEVDLLHQLANQVAIAIHQSQLYQYVQSANRELRQLANLDGLTQIANRRRFDEYLNAEWKRLKREQAPLSLILLDVDFFKRYNDAYGHLAGDDCLRQVAGAIKSVVRRPADLAVRYGGEEFAVILPNTDIQGAVCVAEAIRQAVSNLAIPHSQSKVCGYVTVSLGVAGTVANLELSPQHLINAADAALYAAKKEGRDRVAYV
jgi:diguanylate cyclase (GGDEF)-like protein